MADQTIDRPNQDGPRPRPPYSIQLKSLHQTQTSLEKIRIGIGNRVSAVGRDVDQLEPDIADFYKRLVEQSEEWEKALDDLMASQVRHFPVWDSWLGHVKGIGPALGAHLLALLLPPIPEAGPSTWYKAAGLAPELRDDGTNRLPRPRVGEGPITYYPWLRRCLFLVGQSFVRVGGYYREVYERGYDRLFHLHAWDAARVLDEWKATGERARARWLLDRYPLLQIVEAWQPYLELDRSGVDAWRRFAAGDLDEDDAERFQDTLDVQLLSPAINKSFALVGGSDDTWPLGRIERAARWAMLKLFLSHLYEEWLRAEGVTGRQAYVIEKLGHHYIAPPKPDGKRKI